LGLRLIDLGIGLTLGAGAVHVAHQADYGEPVIVLAAVRAARVHAAETLADGVLAGPVVARERFVDDDDGGSLGCIALVEKAAAQQRNAEGLEVVAGYLVPFERAPLLHRLSRMPLNLA